MKAKGIKLCAAFCAAALSAGLLVGNPAIAREKKDPDTLTVANVYDAKTLDPFGTNDVASSGAMLHIYNRLVKLNDKDEVIGDLAEKIEQVDDLTYRFYLRKGVKFHNGEELKASDVVFSLKRSLAPSSGAVKHIVGAIDPESIVALDDYTVEVKTLFPFAAFLPSMTHMGGGAILNEKAVTEAGDNYGMNPVGTGPFKLVEWNRGDKIVMERFEDYFGEKPAYKTLIIRAIPEGTNRTIELESGNVDIAYQITTNDVSRVEANKELKLLRLIDNSTTYLGFNCEKAPFDDVRVRQAITMALPTPQIIKAVLRGVGAPAVGPIAPNVKYANPDLEPMAYDVEKAKALLAEAGYPDGFKASIWTNDKKARIDIATIAQNQLKKIGVEVDIQVLEWGAYLEGLTQKKHDMFIVGWTCQTPDPDMAVFAPFHSSMKGNNNFTFYGDDEVDALLEKGRVTPDGPERQQVYYDIQDALRERGPWVFMYNDEQIIGTQDYVEGFTVSPFGFHDLSKITFDGK